MRAETGERNNSILYLALLSLVYFLYVSGSRYILPSKEAAFDAGGKIYIEIDDGQGSVVKTFETPQEARQINNSYNIDKILRSGDKVIIQGGKKPEVGRMSGLKSLSLGIPIGINSSNVSDLAALPGIGGKLSSSIVLFRNENGRFNKIEELLRVEGMGEKKLALIKPYIDLN